MNAADWKYLFPAGLSHSEQGPFFTDQYGRHLTFRGCNVTGVCKLPAKPYPSSIDKHDAAFFSSNVSFVGRPFALDDASAHFERLKRWGLTCVRLITTWEALEHDGFQKYDLAYMQYMAQLCNLAGDHGLKVFIDVHQDCWSRWTGGSGAPLWTFEILGMQPKNFEACGASVLQGVQFSGHAQAGTLWATNYTKYAAQTMFTLFFAGSAFAPKTLVGGVPVQEFLQDAYIGSVCELAKHLSGCDSVMGIDPMNEPHHGFIGLPSLTEYNQNVNLHIGEMPSAVQAMALADGDAVDVDVYTKSWPHPTRFSHRRPCNSGHVRAYAPNMPEIWHENGVWERSSERKGSLVWKDDYFVRSAVDGDAVDFYRDCYVPFVAKLMDAVTQVSPRSWWLFLEPVPNTQSKTLLPLVLNQVKAPLCFSPHWYDLRALFEKSWTSSITFNVQELSRGSRNFLGLTYFGEGGARKNYTRQFASLCCDSPATIPRLVGEVGIPFDLDSYYDRPHKDNYRQQTRFLNLVCSGMERNLLSYVLWNYTPENEAERGGGDIWNSEDFSIYCEKDSEDAANMYSGARAASAFVRPYAPKVAGLPRVCTFDMDSRRFELRFIPRRDVTVSPDEIATRTEIFLPRLHYQVTGYRIHTTKGRLVIGTGDDFETVYFWSSADIDEACVVVEVEDAEKPTRHRSLILLLLLVLVSLAVYQYIQL